MNQLANEWRFEVYNKSLSWQNDEEFRQLFARFGFEGQRLDRKFTLWTLANSVSDLLGHTVECGVLFGHSSHLICSAFKHQHDSRHFIFDSFEGLSLPVEKDFPIDATSFKWKRGDLTVSQEEVRRNLLSFTNIEYLKGWIPTRFKEVNELHFSFAHIDVDLYEPTVESVRFFYPRLLSGGILLCDDYGYDTCPGARAAVDEVARELNFSVIHLPTGQGVVFKR